MYLKDFQYLPDKKKNQTKNYSSDPTQIFSAMPNRGQISRVRRDWAIALLFFIYALVKEIYHALAAVNHKDGFHSPK